MPITPDPANREPCCGAPPGFHWEDCPDWALRQGVWMSRADADRRDDARRRHAQAQAAAAAPWLKAFGIP